jgi:outer membrane protein assembly factor BamB
MALASPDDLLKAASKELLRPAPAEQVIKLYANNETGSFSAPLYSTNGELIVGGADGTLFSIDDKLQKHPLFQAGNVIGSKPFEGKDGTLYFGCSGDHCIYAVSPKGELLWGFPTGGSVESTPLLGDDGTIYAGSKDNSLYALYPNGAEKWRYETSGSIFSSPVLDSKGNIMITSLDRSVYSISPEGTRNWRFKAKDGIRTTVALDREDNAYFGDWAGNFFCIDKKGKQQWKFEAEGIIRSSPVLGRDGAVYFGSFPNPMAKKSAAPGIDGHLYALNKDGSLRWKTSMGEPIEAEPALRGDGTIYCGGIFGTLKAMNPDGTVRWTRSLGEDIKSVSLHGPNEDICVTTTEGIYLFCDRNPVARVEDIVLDAEHSGNDPAGNVELSDEWMIIDGVKLPRKSLLELDAFLRPDIP